MFTMPLKTIAIATGAFLAPITPPIFWSCIVGAFITTAIGISFPPMLFFAVLFIIIDILLVWLWALITLITLSPV